MKLILTILLFSCSFWASAKHHWSNWYQLANNHYQNKQLDSAYTNYFRVAHFKQSPDSTKAYSFKKLGIILFQQEEYEKSIENFKQASEHFNNLNDLGNEHKCWSNMANVYVKLGDYDLAENLYQRRLKQALNNKNQAAQLATHINLSYLYNHSNEYHRAAQHLLSAQNLAANVADTLKMNIILNNLSSMYLNQNMPDSALIYLKKSIIHSDNQLLKKAAFKNLYELNRRLGNHDSAYSFLEQYNSISNSIKNENIAVAIAQLEAELQLEKDRAQFASTMNWVIPVIAVLLFGLILVLILRYLEKRNSNQRIKEYRGLTNMFIQQLKVFENEKTELGSKLHSSILPTLVTVRNFIFSGKSEDAMEHLQKSSEELFELQNNQFYNRRFDHSDWLIYTPTNAKHHSKWIEIKFDHDPNIYTHEFQIATLSILEQLLLDGQQKLEVYPDEYGVEVNYSSPIEFSENTSALLSFFDCTVQDLRIHIPILENRI